MGPEFKNSGNLYANRLIAIPVIAGLAVGVAFVVSFGIFLPFVLADERSDRFQIVMKKSTCDGNCPGYAVRVDESGLISFEGYDYLAKPGKHYSVITQDGVKELIDVVEDARFFELANNYGEYSDGGQVTTISITLNNRTKTITNHYPENGIEIYALEKKIDEMLDTDTWVVGK